MVIFSKDWWSAAATGFIIAIPIVLILKLFVYGYIFFMIVALLQAIVFIINYIYMHEKQKLIKGGESR